MCSLLILTQGYPYDPGAKLTEYMNSYLLNWIVLLKAYLPALLHNKILMWTLTCIMKTKYSCFFCKNRDLLKVKQQDAYTYCGKLPYNYRTFGSFLRCPPY